MQTRLVIGRDMTGETLAQVDDVQVVWAVPCGIRRDSWPTSSFVWPSRR